MGALVAAAVLVLVAILSYEYSSSVTAAGENLGELVPSDDSGSDEGSTSVEDGLTSPSSSGIVPEDPSTWPSGDSLWGVCQAVALAEGYNVPGSNPARLCNPGDISDGAETFGFEVHSGSQITVFPDQETGWQWLRKKFQNIANGTSKTYSATESWESIASKYAGDSANWLKNVTGALGVSANSSLKDLLGG